MKVITIYEAFDGKRFDNEKDCLMHELDIMESISDLEILDREGKRLHCWYSDSTYNASMKVVLPSKQAVEDLILIQDCCGFYCDIPANEDSLGTWEYDRFDECWKKVK